MSWDASAQMMASRVMLAAEALEAARSSSDCEMSERVTLCPSLASSIAGFYVSDKFRGWWNRDLEEARN